MAPVAAVNDWLAARGFHHGPEPKERSNDMAADTFAVRPPRPNIPLEAVINDNGAL